VRRTRCRSGQFGDTPDADIVGDRLLRKFCERRRANTEAELSCPVSTWKELLFLTSKLAYKGVVLTVGHLSVRLPGDVIVIDSLDYKRAFE
jgi:hypothetical protein